ncbi:MAG: type III pantothenate kinase [Ruminococcaceae bacterium]|nr:type III pantothenate kinase [Oscillospiraceae bacterium]
MVLTVDVGNTNITFGLFDADKIALISRLATQRQRTPDQYAIDFINILSLHRIDASKIEGAVISSVVPELTNTLVEAVETINKKVIVLAPGIKTGLDIKIDNPAFLGADLAAGAVGVIAHYPLPALVIDLGTASKIYAVDETKSFLGGMIAPGIEISLNALTETSSQLPTIAMNAPSKACSTNTVECMQSGVIFGTACMIDGMLDRFTEELWEPKTVVATGGLAKYIIPECKHEIIYDNYLILKGLKDIFDRNK